MSNGGYLKVDKGPIKEHCKTSGLIRQFCETSVFWECGCRNAENHLYYPPCLPSSVRCAYQLLERDFYHFPLSKPLIPLSDLTWLFPEDKIHTFVPFSPSLFRFCQLVKFIGKILFPEIGTSSID
jgi:hypothetical protein